MGPARRGRDPRGAPRARGARRQAGRARSHRVRTRRG
jgi:hypothetical protein